MSKYDIVYRFASENFKPFNLISYGDVLTLFFLSYNYSDLISFLQTPEIIDYVNKAGIKGPNHFQKEISILEEIKHDFEKYRDQLANINLDRIKDEPNGEKLYSLFFDLEFVRFSKSFHLALKSVYFTRHNLFMHLITDNLRKSGRPYDPRDTAPDNIFTIANLINSIIKSIRIIEHKKPAKIVIDSLRNPFEVMFFKQRYAAFYLLAVNRDETHRTKILKERFHTEYDIVVQLLENEYQGGTDKEFHKQNLRSCIEKADIHITFKKDAEVSTLNEELNKNHENASPYFTWQMQLLKYISLIEKPGLITPSPEERCMQLASTAKYNYGCISRQVGAAITDQHYSVKAIGWNNTPEGHVPCLLRNAKLLLDADTIRQPTDGPSDTADLNTRFDVFTPFEQSNPIFHSSLHDHFDRKLAENGHLLKGRNVCYCFKSLHNSFAEGKNQVHTRALHAEESAFLQISKYGGTGIMGGKLFTTASPCEICAKKAYQLGIKVIYYIDPYPGISNEQILNAGSNKPKVRLFNGAIGNAYHWLYEPLMPYKNELSLILDLEIKDLTIQQKEEIKKLKLRNAELTEENIALKGHQNQCPN